MGFSLLETIGNTPLVEIRKLNPNPKVKVLAKLEYFNPGGSVKDRVALYMIEAGEKSGELTPQKTVIEATSGNTGIGLALVCSIKGYKLLLAMSESVSRERRQILKARGADILLTPGHLGTDGAIEEVYRLVRENPKKYFMVDQYNNRANWEAHYYGTAEEIWQQTGKCVTAFVAALGTTGTLMGISRRLKEYNPRIQIIGVEPYLGHKIQGLKNMKEAYCPEIYEKHRLDKKVNIDDEEAFEMARRLTKEEGIFVGMSSGAAMAVALKEAENLNKGMIVVLLPDGGERYLSTKLFTTREKNELAVYNTLSKKKELFVPLRSDKVSIFSSGPTAYARMHLGEMRHFVFTDQLCRYLTYRGYNVKHIVSITDLDDKTIEGSEKAGLPLADFTETHIRQFREDLATLNIEPAGEYARASHYVNDMVTLSERLVKKGYAYEKLRSLYFDISRFPDYGRLSGIDIDKVRCGATVDLDEYEKANPRDFTLFKRAKLSELKRGIYIKTDWGNVRPSWHIQCAAISMKHLGEEYDIYASNRELLFPHHENVNAIASVLTGKPLARYWMHCSRVLVDDNKTDAKDAGLTLKDLLNMGYTGREIRYWLLSNHYRKSITFSKSRLDDASRSLRRLDRCIQLLRNVQGGTSYSERDQLLYDIKHNFISAMDDDFNISGAISSLFTEVKRINTLVCNKRIDQESASKIITAFQHIDSVLGIFDFQEVVADSEVARLIKERDEARMKKEWKRADSIRKELRRRGVIVHDQKMKE
ncbi:MAG: cysteine--tRNA ligase [bacterium]